MGWEVGRGSGLGTHVHPWRIHVNVWQNQYSIVKQNKVKIKIKKKKSDFLTFLFIIFLHMGGSIGLLCSQMFLLYLEQSYHIMGPHQILAEEMVNELHE